MIKSITNIFQPNLLLILGGAVLVLALYFIIISIKWRKRSATAEAPKEPWPRSKPLGLKERLLPITVFGAIIAAAAYLALKPAPPQYNGETELITIFDVSASMQVAEGREQTTRLDIAKKKINSFIGREKPRKSALILMAGSSFWAMPLSNNIITFERFLAAATTFSISDSGTALAPALELLAEDFCQSKHYCHLEKPLVVLIVSDGEIFDRVPKSLLKRLTDAGFTFIFAAIGEKAAPVPSFDLEGKISGFRVQLNGRPQLSEPNPTLLKDLAQVSGGLFVAQSADIPQVRAILDKPIPQILYSKQLLLLAAWLLALMWLFLRRS